MPQQRISKKDDPLVKTSVSILKSQKEWAEENHINISSVLRESLGKMMKMIRYA